MDIFSALYAAIITERIGILSVLIIYIEEDGFFLNSLAFERKINK